MNELRWISSRAYTNSKCKLAEPPDLNNRVDGYADSPRLTKTKDRLLEDLFDLEIRLRQVASVIENLDVRKELLLAAEWSQTYYKAIQTNKDVGPMTHWYQMRQIHAVANRCIEKLNAESLHIKIHTLAKQIERTNPSLPIQEDKPTVVKKLKELRAIIFTTLEEENQLEENEVFIEIIGNDVDAEMTLVGSCGGYMNLLPKDKYPDCIELWSLFLEIKIRKTTERINMIGLIIDSITTTRLNEAIITSNKQKLLNVMLSPHMEKMIPSKKIEVLKLAIDQKSTEMLENLTDSDWFNDLELEEMDQLIAYAKKMDQTAHEIVIQKSAGYTFYAKK